MKTPKKSKRPPTTQIVLRMGRGDVREVRLGFLEYSIDSKQNITTLTATLDDYDKSRILTLLLGDAIDKIFNHEHPEYERRREDDL